MGITEVSQKEKQREMAKETKEVVELIFSEDCVLEIKGNNSYTLWGRGKQIGYGSKTMKEALKGVEERLGSVVVKEIKIYETTSYGKD